MENATEALHMAFGVLIFVLALSICISIFGQVRATSQYIIETKDRENDYIYITQSDTSRIVGVETIVPAMYRAYKENYIIIFKGLKDKGLKDDVLYEKKTGQETWKPVYSLNLAEPDLAIENDKAATEFVNALLNGELKEGNTKFPKIRQDLSGNNFYDIIKKNKFEETLGLYYMEDVVNSNDDTILSSDANKTEKRVITYTLIEE